MKINCFVKPRCYNLLTEEKDKKIHFFEVLIF